jgi:DNA (cytosine-5)-methyltransferase 1
MSQPTSPPHTHEGLAAIDLFAGAGGLSLGLRRAGFKVLAAIENDSLAVESYQRNHRETLVLAADIQNVSPLDLRRRLNLQAGQLDLLAGCPPCQAFSSMRTKNGKRRPRDAQRDLLFEFLRFVLAFEPKVVMMENVPRLAKDRRMSRFRKELRDLGYTCKTYVLNALDYGVPQRRRRMILLAGRFGPIPLAEGVPTRKTLRDSIYGLSRPGRSRDELHDVRESRSEKVRRLIRAIPKDGGSRLDLGKRRQLKCHQRHDGFRDVYGRLSWDAPAPTITCGFVNPSKGRFLHPAQDRCITPREAALLQSFPRRYFFSLRRGKFPAAGLIGNALPPKLISCLAEPVALYSAVAQMFLQGFRRQSRSRV